MSQTPTITPGDPPEPSLADIIGDQGVAAAIVDVLDELDRAIVKFPGQHLPLGFGSDSRPLPVGAGVMSARELADLFRSVTDARAEVGQLAWVDVLLEEQFEAAAEDDPARARAELVQQAAMCLRAILDIDDPQPISFSAPSGRCWRQIGVTRDGDPILVASGVDVSDGEGPW